MREVMEGRAAPAALAGLLAALVMKGERPEEIAGPRADDARACGGAGRRRQATCSIPAARVAIDRARSTCRRRPRSSSPRAESRWPSMAIDRCRAAAAAPTSSSSWASTSWPRRRMSWSRRFAIGEHRVLLRANVPSVDEARGADPARHGHPDDVQPAGAAHEPGGRHAADRRRSAAGTDAGDGTCADAARIEARVGRARRGRDRRDLNDRSHEGVRVPGRRRSHLLHSSRRSSVSRRRHAADLRGGDAVENAAIIRAVFAGTAGPARDIVLLNAGAALFVAGRASSVREGISRRPTAIDSGAARETLDRMVRASQAEVVA